MVVLARLALVSLLPIALLACESRCETDFDCGDQSYCDESGHFCRTDCYVDADCAMALGCELTDDGCASLGRLCLDGRCQGADVEIGDKPVGLDDDGEDAAPGTGLVFVVDALEIAAPDVGFDLDNRCDPDCIDNVLSPLGNHANPSLSAGVRSSANLLVVEIAGLVDKYAGRDDAVTLKIYSGIDADALVSNNFDGQGTVLIDRDSLTADNRPRTMARARIRNHQLITDESFDLEIQLSVAATIRPTVEFARMRFSFLISPNERSFSNGVLGGALPARALHGIENPYCGQVSVLCSASFADSSLLDLVALTISGMPDVDLDGDGAECAVDQDGDQAIDLCCDAVAPGDACFDTACAVTVPRVDPDDASSCADHREFADGYSVGMRVSGVVTEVVGIGN